MGVSAAGTERAAGSTRYVLPEASTFGHTPESVIRRMTEIIIKQFDPISIILFGSVARGSADSRSDIDLLVIMPEGTDEQEMQIKIRTALHHSPIAKDVLVNTQDRFDRYAKLPGTVQRAALSEGVRLHG
ncbi:MAG: nucleotidyltransferase domain-containing protein [Nitrosopumilaceae archaeon]|nr:nucleotidyltransferase domain-containing protein [Nitrosopumilaceae archaeon]